MLNSKPVTELDYWRAIQDCEQTIADISQRLSTSNRQTKQGKELKRSMDQANDVLSALLLAIEHKFGVFCYKNHPRGVLKPSGKPTYIEWSDRMEQLVAQLDEVQGA